MQKSGKYLLFILAVSLLLTFSLAGTVAAKSAYLINNHHTKSFDAWDIAPGGTVSKQATNTLTYARWPGGVAVHDTEEILFITSEGGTTCEMYDPVALTSLGEYERTGYTGMAGIEVNETDNRVYVAKRATNQLLELSWSKPNLTYVTTHYLSGAEGMMGIGYDDKNKILWVADGYGTNTHQILAYDVDNSFNQVANVTTLSHTPVGCTVDSVRGKVYTVSMSYGAGSPGSSTIVSQYDIATGVERTHSIGYQGVDVAVDETSGYLYMTVAPHSGGSGKGQVRVYDPTDWSLKDADNLAGSPAGIGIGSVSYNPLNLSKDDGVDVGECVYPGANITYNICYDNEDNDFDVDNITILDTLPAEVSFVSATGDGTYGNYDSINHTYTWDIGFLAKGNPGDCIELVVQVEPGTPGGIIIINYATIDSDETPQTTVEVETDVCLGGPHQVCDVNNDGRIDINDIRAILGARGTPASGPDDPADADGDGWITPHDAKLCIQDCDNPGCAP